MSCGIWAQTEPEPEQKFNIFSVFDRLLISFDQKVGRLSHS